VIEAYQMDKLGQDDRGLLLRTEIWAAAIAGDARRAMDRVPALLKSVGDARAMQEAAYVAACAAGDARAADAALKELATLVPGEQRRAISERRRWVRDVGKAAPEVTLALEDGSSVAVADRKDAALVIDFWNVLSKPAAAHVEGLKKLHESFGGDSHVVFVGVNADPPARLGKAQEFAKEAGYPWKQVYEEKAAGAPITHEAFKVASTPWVVVIDRGGIVRAVGEPANPAFVYAVRAAAAEARGDYPPVLARSIEGVEAQPYKPPVVSAKPGGASAGGGGAKPSNPEAAELLKQARLYLKTGKKTDAKRILQEIIDKYPGTREAEEAGYLMPN
jgi:peroxiredoxin